MAILSDKDIIKALKEKHISVKPFDKKYIQPASIDLHLGDTIMAFKDTHRFIDPKESVALSMKSEKIHKKEGFVLAPGEFVLGMIYEETGVDETLVGRLEGKSSLGRLGLIIHATAGYLDPGNKLNMTLELSNLGPRPIILRYKMPIAQLSYVQLSSPCEKPYGSKGLNSKYYGAKKPQASKMYQNYK